MKNKYKLCSDKIDTNEKWVTRDEFKEKLDFYESLYKNENTSDEQFSKYMEVAKEAVNDKKSRIIRGDFLQNLVHNCIKS